MPSLLYPAPVTTPGFGSPFAGLRLARLDDGAQRRPRVAASTKWRHGKLWTLALEGITSFSFAPLKLASYAGFTCALGAFLYALSFLIQTLLVGEAVRGFPTLIVTILLLGGLQLMATGTLDEYLGRLFIETKRRPLYLLDGYRPTTLSLLHLFDEGRA